MLRLSLPNKRWLYCWLLLEEHCHLSIVTSHCFPNRNLPIPPTCRSFLSRVWGEHSNVDWFCPLMHCTPWLVIWFERTASCLKFEFDILLCHNVCLCLHNPVQRWGDIIWYWFLHEVTWNVFDVPNHACSPDFSSKNERKMVLFSSTIRYWFYVWVLWNVKKFSPLFFGPSHRSIPSRPRSKRAHIALTPTRFCFLRIVILQESVRSDRF